MRLELFKLNSSLHAVQKSLPCETLRYSLGYFVHNPVALHPLVQKKWKTRSDFLTFPGLHWSFLFLVKSDCFRDPQNI